MLSRKIWELCGLVVPVAASLAFVGCGGDDGDKGDLAAGKVFEQGQVQRCLRQKRLRIERRQTDTGIDLTARWRSGFNSVDVAVEATPADAADREQEWKHLAEQAQIEDAGSYYFRYGNVLVGFERTPDERDRALIDSCLS